MNREILFRGKRVDNGEWVYGYLVYDKDRTPYIAKNVETYNCDEEDDLYATSWFQTITETIGEYTGLKDKNGKKIFEGDIVKTYANYGYGQRVKKVEVISQVIYKVDEDKTVSGLNTNHFSGFRTKQLNKQDYTNVDWSMFFQCEVIGNIYDGDNK